MSLMFLYVLFSISKAVERISGERDTNERGKQLANSIRIHVKVYLRMQQLASMFDALSDFVCLLIRNENVSVPQQSIN